MTVFWIVLAAVIVSLCAGVMWRDRRRGRLAHRNHLAEKGDRQRLKEFRRQAIAESDFIVPSGMTHAVGEKRSWTTGQNR